ncbi:Uncharacterized membrane protein YqjE [Polynucleobacter meluiroseus]|uniref:Uncharacterized membrane protein YqjE n=1 Tax=Polynucleobacter meluiroseus TaxID=1938814 RepID=A0A240E0A9_9BURK|nr:phage holin family protein [Polynucleobacter meluiroseus]SNX28642.1 Uncharacterized membrane protein YqjE [Polynucleobacter meluiroseus]
MSQENILSSIQNLVATGIALVQNRLELISIDVQIARSRTISLFVLVACALFFLFFGLVMLALLIVIYSWESNRLLALSMLAGGFLMIGALMATVVLRSLKTMPKLFEATIAEFAKDRQELSGK